MGSIEQVLDEAETVRKFNEKWQAGGDAGFERGHVIERPREQGETVDREQVRLPDQFPEVAQAREGEAMVDPPMTAPKGAGKEKKAWGCERRSSHTKAGAEDLQS